MFPKFQTCLHLWLYYVLCSLIFDSVLILLSITILLPMTTLRCTCLNCCLVTFKFSVVQKVAIKSPKVSVFSVTLCVYIRLCKEWRTFIYSTTIISNKRQNRREIQQIIENKWLKYLQDRIIKLVAKFASLQACIQKYNTN